MGKIIISFEATVQLLILITLPITLATVTSEKKAIAMKGKTNSEFGHATEYLRRYWGAVPPKEGVDPCQDFHAYICPRNRKEPVPIRRKRDNMLLHLGELRRPSYFGKYEYNEQLANFIHHYEDEDVSFPAEVRTRISDLIGSCTMLYSKGGLTPERLKTIEEKDKAQLDRSWETAYPAIDRALGILQHNTNNIPPFTVKILKQDSNWKNDIIALSEPNPAVPCQLVRKLENDEDTKEMKNVLKKITGQTESDASYVISAKICEIYYPEAQHYDYEHYCKDDSKWDKDFNEITFTAAALGLLESSMYMRERKKSSILVQPELWQQGMKFLCWLEKHGDKSLLIDYMHYLRASLLERTFAARKPRNPKDSIAACNQLIVDILPEVFLYAGNEYAEFNQSIYKSPVRKIWRSSTKGSAIEVLQSLQSGDAVITDVWKNLGNLVMELPRSAKLYIFRNLLGPNFPTIPQDSDKFIEALIQINQHKSNLLLNWQTASIALATSLMMGSPFFWSFSGYPEEDPYSVYLSAFWSTPPMVEPNWPKFMQHSLPGFVLAHEFSHGLQLIFESQPLNTEFRSNYQKFKKCLVDEYSKNNIFPRNSQLKLDGKFTYRENFADVIGLQIALNAYNKVKATDQLPPGLEPRDKDKLFFMAMATSMVFCNPDRKNNKYLAWAAQLSDMHTQGKNRLNQLLKLTPEFSKAFGCSNTTKMGAAPEKCLKEFHPLPIPPPAKQTTTTTPAAGTRASMSATICVALLILAHKFISYY